MGKTGRPRWRAAVEAAAQGLVFLRAPAKINSPPSIPMTRPQSHKAPSARAPHRPPFQRVRSSPFHCHAHLVTLILFPVGEQSIFHRRV